MLAYSNDVADVLPTVLASRQSTRESSLSSFLSAETPIELIHFERVSSLKKKKCRVSKCQTTTKKSCGASSWKKGPYFLCGKHMKEHHVHERLKLEGVNTNIDTFN